MTDTLTEMWLANRIDNVLRSVSHPSKCHLDIFIAKRFNRLYMELTKRKLLRCDSIKGTGHIMFMRERDFVRKMLE